MKLRFMFRSFSLKLPILTTSFAPIEPFLLFESSILPRITSINTMSTSVEQNSNDVRLLSQKEAIELDQELFSTYDFSVDQLMELAGLSVACAIKKTYSSRGFSKAIICCGPGNNGGDGLVCARHLKTFGFQPIVVYPKPTMTKLANQCKRFGIPVLEAIPEDYRYNHGDIIVDAIFGFSYKPPNRNVKLALLLNHMHHMNINHKVPIVSVDIPSGWSVESGPKTIHEDQKDQQNEMKIPILEPDCLISLTAPKLCSQYFKGRFHYLGGRFCPPDIEKKYQLSLPIFEGTEQVALLTSTENLSARID